MDAHVWPPLPLHRELGETLGRCWSDHALVVTGHPMVATGHSLVETARWSPRLFTFQVTGGWKSAADDAVVEDDEDDDKKGDKEGGGRGGEQGCPKMTARSRELAPSSVASSRNKADVFWTTLCNVTG